VQEESAKENYTHFPYYPFWVGGPGLHWTWRNTNWESNMKQFCTKSNA